MDRKQWKLRAIGNLVERIKAKQVQAALKYISKEEVDVLKICWRIKKKRYSSQAFVMTKNVSEIIANIFDQNKRKRQHVGITFFLVDSPEAT